MANVIVRLRRSRGVGSLCDLSISALMFACPTMVPNFSVSARHQG
jgi:hypothetical protein